MQIGACQWQLRAGEKAATLWESSFGVPLQNNAATRQAQAVQQLLVLPDTVGPFTKSLVQTGVVVASGYTQFVVQMEPSCGQEDWGRHFSSHDTSGDEPGEPPACTGSQPWTLTVDFCDPG